MIHRDHNLIEFECDDCGAVLETETPEWGEALQRLKNDGWVSRKNGDQWEHFCAECEELH